jgi:SAM-dependent methyltransferase
VTDVPTIKPEVRELILGGLATPYTSKSCSDGIQTGNHYQSIRLGSEATVGFRTGRDQVLDRISFTGRTVLDLGSNLGELSRAARMRGAVLVDGFEYDPYFIELANLINAYNGTTRVSFYRRDITDAAVYGERYDIVLAFSVFTYIHRAIAQIAAITNDLLVVETHKLEGNLESLYLNTFQPYFPSFEILGETEWGTPHAESERRMVLALGRNEKALARALHAEKF